jgi:hypothetical protein
MFARVQIGHASAQQWQHSQDSAIEPAQFPALGIIVHPQNQTVQQIPQSEKHPHRPSS